jgi:hypothetical protein
MDGETKTFFLQHMRQLNEKLDAKFEQIDQRFETIDRRFETVDQRFDAQDGITQGLIDMIDRRFVALEDEVRHTRETLLRLENTGGLKEKVDIQGDMIQRTSQRIDRIEDHLHLERAFVCDKPKKRYSTVRASDKS